MPTTCNIVFDNNPSGTFYGGQILSAKITINLDEPKEIKGIALKIKGSADTHWTEHQHTHHNHRHNRNFNGHEDYINIKTFLLGTPETESITLEAGEHVYWFNYHLPITCPSSVESQYGKIRYKMKVIMVRPWKFDTTFTKGFTIVKLVDLNYQPMVACPVTQELVKQFGIGLWKTKPMQMRVSVPQSGYVPGQKIPVSISIVNESNKPIKELKIALIMATTCYSQTPTRHMRDHVTNVSKIKNETVVNTEKDNSIYELPVPPLPPSDNTFSSLVHISYQIKVEAVMPMMQSNQSVILPVVIGSVPLMNIPQIQYPTTTVVVVPPPYDKAAESDQNVPIVNAPAETPITPPWECGASNIPPPSYEEAMFMPHVNMAENEQHDYGESDFVPRYPVFNVSSQTLPEKPS